MFDWVWKLLYSIQYAILYLIDFVVSVFRLLAGLNDVKIPEGENEVSINLLSYFLTSQTVLRAFMLVAAISLALVTFFTIIAVIRKQYLEEKEQRSIGAIVGQALKSCLMFVLIPVIMIISSYAIIVIVQQLEIATSPYVEEILITYGGTNSKNGYSGLSISGTLLYIIGYDCIQTGMETDAYGLLTVDDITLLSYENVKDIFDMSDLNWFLGYVAGIAIFILFIKSLFMFVERIFNIIGLFVVAPVAASSSVLDGGVRFKSWRDQVINNFIVGYSVIIGMNIYFLVLPIVITIDFGLGGVGNWLVDLFFMVGGAFAVNKMLTLFGNIINQGAGSQAQATSDAFGRGLGHAAAGAARTVGRGVSRIASSGWQGFKDATGFETPIDRLKNRGEALRNAKKEARDGQAAARKWKENFYAKNPEAKQESDMDKLNATVKGIADKLGVGQTKNENTNPNLQNQQKKDDNSDRLKFNPYSDIDTNTGMHGADSDKNKNKNDSE